MSVVAVVDPAEEHITVKVTGFRRQFKVTVFELQGTQAEDHGLQNSFRSWCNRVETRGELKYQDKYLI